MYINDINVYISETCVRDIFPTNEYNQPPKLVHANNKGNWHHVTLCKARHCVCLYVPLLWVHAQVLRDADHQL